MEIIAGVIGCGSISKFHFSGLEKAGARIKWVCDLYEESMLPWQKRFDAKGTQNYKDILNDPEVNLVVITTFTSLHKSMCLDVISKGKSVIVEKNPCRKF